MRQILCTLAYRVFFSKKLVSEHISLSELREKQGNSFNPYIYIYIYCVSYINHRTGKSPNMHRLLYHVVLYAQQSKHKWEHIEYKL